MEQELHFHPEIEFAAFLQILSGVTIKQTNLKSFIEIS